MTESGHGPARSARARLQESPRPTTRFSSAARTSLRSSAGGSEQPVGRTPGELWPGQAAEEAAREAARAAGAPRRGYRPSAYQDEYLAGAAVEPFVYVPAGSGSPFAKSEPEAGAGTTGTGRTGGAITSGAVGVAGAVGPTGAGGGAGSLFAKPEQVAHGASLFADPTPSPSAEAPAAHEGSHGASVTDGDDASADDTSLGDDALLGDDDQPRSRRGRTVALVGGLLAIVAVGAGGTVAYSVLGGGGPQPESALPATTVAFLKVDLDPSAGQKVDAIRFLRAFPQAREKVAEDSDLREVAFTALQGKDTTGGPLKGIDYATDVKPWLGQRLALGLVPGASAQQPPTVVLALAVTDPAAARAHLPALATALGGACEVMQDFALCTPGTDGSSLDAVVTATARGTLADAASFRQDMSDLGETGVAAAWVDSAKTAEALRALPPFAGLSSSLARSSLAPTSLLSSAVGPSSGPSAVAPPASYGDAGRTAVALRFDGPHLELAGHTNDAKAAFVGSKHVTGVTSLPWDSLAAVSVANGGDQLRAAWPDIEASLSGILDQGSPLAAAQPGGPMPSGPLSSKPTSTKPLSLNPQSSKRTGGSAAPSDGRPLAAAEELLGIRLPEDLYAALGSQFTVVFGGVEARNGDLKAAIVGNGDQVVLGQLAKSGQALGAEKLTMLPSPGRSVLATSDEYGQAVVTGSGLGAMPSFRDAVEDVKDARVVGYVDIAGLVAQYKDQLDPKDTAELANLSALGLTISGEGHSADFRLRLTTK